MATILDNESYLKAYKSYIEDNGIKTPKVDQTVYIGGQTFPINYEMFYNYIIDKIAYSVVKTKTFQDPLAFLYSGDIYPASIIEDVRTVLLSEVEGYGVKNFESDITNPFTKNKNSVSTVYHRITEYKKSKITVSYHQLQTAFNNTYGIDALVNATIQDLSTQFNAYWYSKKREVLEQDGWSTPIYFEDYADFAVKIKNIGDDFSDYDNSVKYNRAAIPSPTADADITVIISKKYRNEVDINYFTGLYNVAFAEWKGNLHYINSFKDDNIVAMIFDNNGVFFKKALNTMRKLENGEDLTYNYFVHEWQMLSVSPHYNAVKLLKKPDGLTLSAASIDSGVYKGTQAVTISVSKTENAKTSYILNNAEAVDITADTVVNINTSSTLKVITSVNDKEYKNIYSYRIIANA